MELDLLERARAGDPDALAGLVSTWGDRIARTAALLTGDRDAAYRATAAAFADTWTTLPTMHSERPFRPALLRALGAAAETEQRIAGDDARPLWRALSALPFEQRLLAVLHLHDELGATELALIRREHLARTARAQHTALKSFTAAARAAGVAVDEEAAPEQLRELVRGVEIPPWFADELLAPRLEEAEAPGSAREIELAPDAAWAQLLDPATLIAAADGTLRTRTPRIEPGVRLSGTGMLAGARSSRDEVLITRASHGMLAWTTRTRIRPWPSAIELRWWLTTERSGEGTRLTLRLRGVSFPPGATGRFLRAAYARVADRMPEAIDADLGRLVEAITSSSSRSPL